MNYTPWQILFFFLVYSFLGWCFEAVCRSYAQRKLVNPGFLSMPLILCYGVTMVQLCVVLPTFGDQLGPQYVMTLIISAVTETVCNFSAKLAAPGLEWPQRSSLFSDRLKGIALSLAIALGYFVVYQIIQPLFLALSGVTRVLLIKILIGVFIAFVAVDVVTVMIVSRKGKYKELHASSQSSHMAMKLNLRVWRRIEKAYPGINEVNRDEIRQTYTFGKGLNFDKVIWVFFISALLGDLIETCYCGLINGEWMNRSSVLYGNFSFVWGIGAVLLTIALLPLSHKNDRWVFAGGFVIGGAFEYMCSVFTEVVFGTVFWDYSYMPLNIGGRTNVLFCFFWGALSLLWVKMIYPHLSVAIEKIPPVTGKIITWIIVVVMSLNALLTMTAMIRFNIRKIDPTVHNQYEAFLDIQYPDSVIESHWPNMIVVDETPSANQE